MQEMFSLASQSGTYFHVSRSHWCQTKILDMNSIKCNHLVWPSCPPKTHIKSCLLRTSQPWLVVQQLWYFKSLSISSFGAISHVLLWAKACLWETDLLQYVFKLWMANSHHYWSRVQDKYTFYSGCVIFFPHYKSLLFWYGMCLYILVTCIHAEIAVYRLQTLCVYDLIACTVHIYIFLICFFSSDK